MALTVCDDGAFDCHATALRVRVDALEVPARVNDVALARGQIADEVDQIREVQRGTEYDLFPLVRRSRRKVFPGLKLGDPHASGCRLRCENRQRGRVFVTLGCRRPILGRSANICAGAAFHRRRSTNTIRAVRMATHNPEPRRGRRLSPPRRSSPWPWTDRQDRFKYVRGVLVATLSSPRL